MSKIPGLLYGWDLKELWNSNDLTLADYVLNHGLPAYEPDTMKPVDAEREREYRDNLPQPYGGFEQQSFPVLQDRIVECVFKEDEVIEFAKKNDLPSPEGKEHLHQEPRRQKDNKKTERLASKEARELGQLRTEKQKWDKSIKVTAHAVLFATKQGRRITREELWKELEREKLDDIPNTTFERIWKAIPEELRNLGGRPKSSS